MKALEDPGEQFESKLFCLEAGRDVARKYGLCVQNVK